MLIDVPRTWFWSNRTKHPNGGWFLVSKSCLTLAIPWTVARLFCPWDSPSKNTEVCCHFLLQRIFMTQDQTQVS